MSYFGGSAAFESALLHVQDRQASGAEGGSSTANTWVTRVLNTVLTNEISGASLASNQVTLPIGDYYVTASCPSQQTIGRMQARLYDITGAAELLRGYSSYDQSGNRAIVEGRFSVTVETVIELRHNCQIGVATRGLGTGTGVSVTGIAGEVFSDLKIWKVG